jgi:hypothetical protein
MQMIALYLVWIWQQLMHYLVIERRQEDFKLINQGNIDPNFGLLICDIYSTTLEMSQLFLISWILLCLLLGENKSEGYHTPVRKSLLNWDLGGVPCKHICLYPGAVGMLSYHANII